MTKEEQLGWEARWGRHAGIAAIVAALLLVVSSSMFFEEDREGIERGPDLLLSIDANSGAYLAQTLLAGLAALILMPAFLYLFRASVARGAGMPNWFVYVIFGAPVVYAFTNTLVALDAIDFAEEFASGRPIRGEAGEDRAEDIGGVNAALYWLGTIGTVGLAFLFVMLPLRARRVGLLTPFMGILGVLVGALVVFQLRGVTPVVEGFWLGALGLLLLGRWPGGRGPAWEIGEAVPWPSAAQRRGLVAMPGEEPQLDPDAPPPEPEPVPERPASRKRRKKKRR